MWARALHYIPAAPSEVLDEATRSGNWSAWLGVAEATADRRLDAVGSRVTGKVRGRRGEERSVTWRVARRLRDIVGLEAVDGAGHVVATLTISCSWWDGACATELAIEVVGRDARPRWATERALRRALRRLDDRITSGPATAPAHRRTWCVRSARVAGRLPGS